MPAAIPLSDILKVRRHQPTRLEGFVDASFAFAVTLIVISIGHVPHSVDEMLLALRGIPAFFACFLMISRIWLSHRDWSRHYNIEDTTGLVLSLVLIFVVLIYVYPLRMLFAQMFAGLSRGWLNDGSFTLLSQSDELSAAYIVFALGLGMISLVFVLLYGHALRCASDVGLSAQEILITRLKLMKWVAQLAFAAGSVMLSLWLPMTSTFALSAPGLVYALNSPVAIFLRRRCRRALAALPAAIA
jgi:uncharacterized membrane protein